MTDVEAELLPVREALCYLPAWCGRSYAQASVPGGFLRFDLREALIDVSMRMDVCRRLEKKPYLDKDHDFRTPLYILEKACLVENEGIFCLGYWTREGLRLRSSFCGVSHSCVQYSKKYPPPEEYLTAKKRQAEEEENKKNIAHPDCDSIAALGCVCVDCAPTFTGTIKTLPLDGADNDPLRLLSAFNATKISWPIMPIPPQKPNE